jgi:hypothetical protein
MAAPSAYSNDDGATFLAWAGAFDPLLVMMLLLLQPLGILLELILLGIMLLLLLIERISFSKYVTNLGSAGSLLLLPRIMPQLMLLVQLLMGMLPLQMLMGLLVVVPL